MPIKTEDEPTTTDQLEPNNYPVELAGVEEEEPVDVLAPPEIHHHHLEDVNVDVAVDHAVNVAVAAAVEVAVDHHEHHEHLEHNAADDLMAPQQPMGTVKDPLAAVAVDVGVDVGEVDQEQEQAALDAGEEAAAAAMEA